MHISAIVAMDENRVIGRNNQLPWRLPADLQHFKKVTMGKAIVMGRKTYESIGRPLPGRENIVMTRDPTLTIPGCTVVTSIPAVLELASASEELFIIGGEHVFEAFLPMIERLYLTIIHAKVEGDAYFPKLKMEEWQEKERVYHGADAENEYEYSFVVLERVG